MSKKTIHKLFRFARKEGAHGLTIESRANHLAFDYRFPDGERQKFSLPKKLEKELLGDLYQLLKLAPGDFEAKKYCKISDQARQNAFYVTIIPGRNGEKIIIDQAIKNDKPWRLKQLGCSRALLHDLKSALDSYSGLILISGQPNSGRSSTLTALLRELDLERHNAYLLSEPPGQEIAGLNIMKPARQAWTSLQRHDADIVAADDLDQPEDLESAVRLAMTGRLVLAATTADNLKEAWGKISSLPLPLKSKRDSLKIITHQKLTELPLRSAARKNGRRQEIAVFDSVKPGPELDKL